MATPNLGITEVLESQSNKVVTINEAIVALDNAGNASSDVDTAAGGTIAVAAAVFNRAVVLALTGAPAGAYNLEVPANERLFAVDNQSGQTATVQVTGGGGASVDVADGEQLLLHSDATDVKSYGGGSSGGGGGSSLADYGLYLPGVPVASQVLSRLLFAQAVDTSVNLAGSLAVSGVAATASTDFDLQKNGASIGTLNFAIGATTGTFTVASGQNFAIGDTFEVVAPAAPDATLADITITLQGTKP
jgi:hypothetical protein